MLPHKFRWSLLLFASCVFYMFFKPVYILILFFTIVIDYWAGLKIESASPKHKKPFLIASLIANIGVLAVFKYFNFFSGNLNGLFHIFHIDFNLPYLKILLPIGLSFHTFQAMSYTIEVYWGKQKAEKNFGIYALYVMFYPQLVAGPIERPQHMLHQFYEKHQYDYFRVVSGLRQVLWGVFKKVVIADRLSIVVDHVYGHHTSFTGLPLIIGVVFFAFQIYCDFSGYSDIALGTARVMGFTLMKNFNFPFRSRNITEFWRRWHISLSTWFNDYVFTPIVISKRSWGTFAVVFALFITFSISGLWHGAGWTFIIYGIMHGVAVIYDVLTKKSRKRISKSIPGLVYNNASVILTFSYVAVSWIFFRSKDFSQAFYIIRNLFNFSGDNSLFKSSYMILQVALGVFFIVLLEVLQRTQKEKTFDDYLQNKRTPVRWAYYIIITALIVNFGVFGDNQFIYFQF
jgi:alginate O-acetyltransferase complex protein AlgI